MVPAARHLFVVEPDREIPVVVTNHPVGAFVFIFVAARWRQRGDDDWLERLIFADELLGKLTKELLRFVVGCDAPVLHVMQDKSKLIVCQGILPAVLVSVRGYYSGPMTLLFS